MGENGYLAAHWADVDDLARWQRRGPRGLGDVGGQLESIERIAIGVAIPTQASGSAAKVCRPGTASATNWNKFNKIITIVNCSIIVILENEQQIRTNGN